MMYLLVFLLACSLSAVNSASSNSYSDCLAVASKFATTISNGPVADITATSGVPVQCAQLTDSACPGSIINGVCTWQRKLSVTCIKGSPVRIRIQSNGLPGRCAAMPSTATFSEIHIDFEVNFNPDVSLHSPVHSPTTVSALDSIVCNTRSQSAVPQKSAYVSYSRTSMATIVGVAVDNVAILNANMANGGDPFHPPSGQEQERVDSCLGHCQMSGIYHYHMASGCIVSPPSGTIEPCTRNRACVANMSAYSITTFPSSARTLTVIGIAKDGHVIYGPYQSTGTLVNKGTDICNGMFYDSLGNYAYFATQKFPYITGQGGKNLFAANRNGCD